MVCKITFRSSSKHMLTLANKWFTSKTSEYMNALRGNRKDIWSFLHILPEELTDLSRSSLHCWGVQEPKESRGMLRESPQTWTSF